MNKYRNKKITTSEGNFDSKKEYHRWQELKLLQQAGEISDLQKQVKFELIPKQQGERSVTYVADYVYMQNGVKVVEDVKSEITRKTPQYIIKRKLMLWVHDQRISEV